MYISRLRFKIEEIKEELDWSSSQKDLNGQLNKRALYFYNSMIVSKVEMKNSYSKTFISSEAP